MALFSRRNGYVKSKLQYEGTDQALRNRIWNVFYEKEFSSDVNDWGLEFLKSYPITAKIADKMGLPADISGSNLRDKVFSGDWYLIYDFVESYLECVDKKTLKGLILQINSVLQEECSAYRIVDKIIAPITNEAEIASIEQGIDAPYPSVNTHLRKALELYSDRQKSDYENSVKESISAVEAMCCIITGKSGKQATLGSAIKKLSDSGVHIHGSMEKAFLALYGYTSDENGIRHGGIDFTDVPAEDAKYMLVSCSAFVNYLIEKWHKVGSVS